MLLPLLMYLTSVSQTAAETVLARIPPNASRLSYSFENWLFHYVADDNGLVFLCTADGETGRRLPFAFLSDMQKKVSMRTFLERDLIIKQFHSTFDHTLLQDPNPRDFLSFTPVLRSSMHKYNTQPQSDPVKAAQAELEGVKDIMTQNVEQILNRGERLDLLMNRTDQAANQSMAFRRRAVGLRRQMWYKNAKVAGMAVFCVVVSYKAPDCPHTHCSSRSSSLFWLPSLDHIDVMSGHDLLLYPAALTIASF